MWVVGAWLGLAAFGVPVFLRDQETQRSFEEALALATREAVLAVDLRGILEAMEPDMTDIHPLESENDDALAEQRKTARP